MKEQEILYRKLPILEILRYEFSHVNLKNTLIISVQHLCSTTYSLFRYFFDLGLNPNNLHVLGKCYSTNPKIFQKLKKDGVIVSQSSLFFNSHISYDLYFENRCDALIKNAISMKNIDLFERIIILDDGGHLIERANLIIPKHLDVVGIEQTSSGFNRLKNEAIFFPIINTARSWLKLNYESSIIAELMKRKLVEKLDKTSKNPKQILIIGYGSIGKQAHKALKNNYDVMIFDSNQKESMISKADFISRLNEFDIILGCTGATSLTSNEYKYLKKPVILASVSSSDREFEAVKLRQFHQIYRNCHTDLSYGGITLLNSGFPITFDDDYDGIDTDDFQLTRALLFISTCQAFLMKTQKVGFVDLSDKYQKMVLKNMKDMHLL